MATPFKHPKTEVYYFRKAVPADLRQPLGRIEILRSLGTKDAEEAKLFHAEVAIEVAKEWARVRKLIAAVRAQQPVVSGPAPALHLISLSHRDTVALSGEIYKEFVTAHEEEPGDPSEWDRVLTRMEAARSDRYKERHPQRGDSIMDPAFVARKQFGSKVQEFLEGRGLAIDTKSYEAVCNMVASVMPNAVAQLKRNARGDYSADPAVARFPVSDKLVARAPVVQHVPISFDDFIEKWTQGTVKAVSSRQSWKGKLKNLMEFTGKDDVAAITQADVVAWRDARIASGIEASTVAMGDLSGVRSMFAWAVKEPKLPSITVNPVVGVHQDYSDPVQTREKGFTFVEADKILTGTLVPYPNLRANAGARRWMPWLMAFSGARVGEVGQLHADNVFEEVAPRGVKVWCMNLTPDDGTIKTGVYRKVPLHPQVIEQGFLEFVRSRRGKPLFYNPELARVPGSHHRQSDKVGESLAKWVRGLGIKEPVQPNHAWRHRFESIGRSLEIREDLINYITGHKTDDVASKYGDYFVVALNQVIRHFPRYLEPEGDEMVPDDGLVNGLSIFARPNNLRHPSVDH